MQEISNRGAGKIIADIAEVIVSNKAYLSEIDGKIGDGDHGINMAKGFGRAADRLDPDGTLTDAMEVLSDVLMSEIGGSMGPLYGMMFSDMAESLADKETIDVASFGAMLRAGLDGVQQIGNASVGDKTLIDTFSPAVDGFDAAVEEGKSFAEALSAMKGAAEAGRDSTIDLVAKLGRSARLGERSRGVLDAGATSCCMILSGFADSITARLT
nr:dihydroxyacetone kinase subunit DhaL [uncultured Cohaesibacter sp.]